MKSVRFLLCLAGASALTLLAACTSTSSGASGGGASSSGYQAPAPMTTADQTEAIRSEYRDWIR